MFGGQWRTADFRAGDILLFGMKTVHMSTTNTTEHVRLSCDVRWQPAADPIDARYVGDLKHEDGGELKVGIEGVNKAEGEATGPEPEAAPTVTIQELRRRWGFPVRDGHEFK